MRISKFEDFNRINEEEGWKENILVGILSLFGASAIGQTPQKQTVHTGSEKSMENLIKQGWSLDSTKVDTIFTKVKQESPQSEVMVVRLSLDKDQYFASGKFTLSQAVKDSIYNSMAGISNGLGVITDINISSSTDKQGLSDNLQRELKSMGYSGDNQGLSSARSDAVSGYLKELGVNDTIIKTEQKSEQGSGTIDPSARYVTVDIYYIQKIPAGSESQEGSVGKTKTNYYLSKEVNIKGDYKFHGGYHKVVKKGPIKNHKRDGNRLDKCTYKM